MAVAATNGGCRCLWLQAGMKPGIALTPDTPAEALFPVVESGAVDTVLLLSVRPGGALLAEHAAKVQAPRGIHGATAIVCCVCMPTLTRHHVVVNGDGGLQEPGHASEWNVMTLVQRQPRQLHALCLGSAASLVGFKLPTCLKLPMNPCSAPPTPLPAAVCAALMVKALVGRSSCRACYPKCVRCAVASPPSTSR